MFLFYRAMDPTKEPRLDRPEFERKFAEIRKHTRRHTVESLTSYAGEYLRELENYMVERNGLYEGTVLPKELPNGLPEMNR